MAAFVKQAGVPEGKYSIAFQSRLGRDPWLKPYTDFELPRLAQGGVKKLLVMCPAFVSDCLESWRKSACADGTPSSKRAGTQSTLIPCLNEYPLWLEALENMVSRFLREAEKPQSGPKALA